MRFVLLGYVYVFVVGGRYEQGYLGCTKGKRIDQKKKDNCLAEREKEKKHMFLCIGVMSVDVEEDDVEVGVAGARSEHTIGGEVYVFVREKGDKAVKEDGYVN